MLGSFLRTVHHIRRVHAMVPDPSLGQIVKDKLTRLNLQPVLAELQRRNAVGTPSPSPSASSSETSTQLDGATMCYLLDSLAYFHLGASPVTRDALQLVHHFTSTMNVRQLARTLGACCALEEQGVIVPTVPLLMHALQNSLKEQECNSNNTSATGRRTLSLTSSSTSGMSMSRAQQRSWSTTLQTADDVVCLMEALQVANVHQEDVWRLLAEHCVRCMESFDADQLLRVLGLFQARQITACPDFFLAAESYIAAQMAATANAFMTMDQLHEVIECYKTLGQPVVALVSIGAGRSAESFDTTLRKVVNSASSTVLDETQDMEAFVTAAVRAAESASAAELSVLLRKCDRKRVMHASVIAAIASRLQELYFPHGIPRPGTEASTSDTAVEDDRGTTTSSNSSAVLSAQDLTSLTTVLTAMMSFKSSTYFVDAAVTLSAMLNAIAAQAMQHYTYRLLLLAHGAATLFPPITTQGDNTTTEKDDGLLCSTQPVHFYRALTSHLRRTKDIATHVGPQRLQLFTNTMIALGKYGGTAVLQQYLPLLTVEVVNVPRRVQTEMACALAGLPEARQELLPAIYRAVQGTTRRWSESLSPREVQQLLAAMQTSRTRDTRLIAGLVSFITAHKHRFQPDVLVRHLHTLVVLGYRDIEFHSAMASHLLENHADESGPNHRDARHATTVHDLCQLLYVFTLLLKDMIRVVQQMLLRLKVSISQATPHDITLALYSIVKLHVERHHDLTRPLCERLFVTLSECTTQEFVSVWSSLRTLGYVTSDLLHASCALIRRQVTTSKIVRDVNGPGPLTTMQFVTFVSAIVHLTDPSLVELHEGHASGSERLTPAFTHSNNDEEKEKPDDQLVQRAFKTAAFTLLSSRSSSEKGTTTTLPAVTGLQMYLVITTLAVFPALRLTRAEWRQLASGATRLGRQLTRGYHDTEGMALAEVVLALHRLRQRCDNTENDTQQDSEGSSDVLELPEPLLQLLVLHRKALLAQPALRAAYTQNGLLHVLQTGSEHEPVSQGSLIVPFAPTTSMKTSEVQGKSRRGRPRQAKATTTTTTAAATASGRKQTKRRATSTREAKGTAVQQYIL